MNAIPLAFAYLCIYPNYRPLTWGKLLLSDLLLTMVLLVLAAALFAGADLKFNLFFFETNWLAFGIVSIFCIETPLLIWLMPKITD